MTPLFAISFNLQSIATVIAVLAACVYLTWKGRQFVRNAAAGQSSSCGSCPSQCASHSGGADPQQVIGADTLGAYPGRRNQDPV